MRIEHAASPPRMAVLDLSELRRGGVTPTSVQSANNISRGAHGMRQPRYSETTSHPIKCWMCECVCSTAGWTDMPIQLRPEDADDAAQCQSDGGRRLSGTAQRRRPLTHMTLCRRCTTGLGMPPGAPLLDVIHACNSTHVARTRSHTFVAFLREYRILLELIALEFEETGGIRAPLSEANMGPVNAQQVAEQLLGCIEDTMREDRVLVGSARVSASPGRRTPATRARRGVGSEWLLSATERELLVHEGKYQRGIVAILTKRHDLSVVDAERHHHAHHHHHGRHDNLLATTTGDATPVRHVTKGGGGGVSLAAVVHRGKDLSARGGASGPPCLEQPPHTQSSTLGPAMHQLREGSSSTHRDREALLLRFFSESSAPLPDRIFELAASSSDSGGEEREDGGGVANTGVDVPAPSEAGHTTRRAVAPLVTATGSDARCRSAADTLMRVENELEVLRREHDSQRNAWNHERMSLMLERDALRTKVDSLQTAAQLAARQQERQRAEMEAAANAISRTADVQRTVAVRFAGWMHNCAERCCELQWKKAELLGVESRAVVGALVARQERARRHEDTAKMDEERTQQYMRLVAQARRELLQTSPQAKRGTTAANTSGPSKPLSPPPPFFAALPADHHHHAGQDDGSVSAGSHRGEISVF